MGMSKFKHDRPTIGILPGWSALAGKTPDRYLASVLKGIQSAARIRECHLLLGWGLGRGNDPSNIHPAWPEVSPDSDFVPVGPWNTDGLIVFAPLRHEARSLYLQKLSDQSYPVLFIATGEREPMISVDNEAGIHQAVAHLVDHGHRDIGFIAGDPNDKGDSESRLRAYHSAVVNYGLDTDPRLVAQGWHTFSGGYDAARKIIDSEVKLTALVASDDISAIGAMQAIRDNGLRIPGDIAIIGFDDQPDAIAQVPPLTSVHVPLAQIGEQAMLLMVDHLTGEHHLESVRIPTRLVPRQSCGCMPYIVSSAADGQPRSLVTFSQVRERDSIMSEVIPQIVNEMLATLPSALRFPKGERIQRLCTNLLQAFYSSLKDGSSVHFQATLMELLQELELADDNIDPWQDIISTLRREMTQLPAVWRQSHTRGLAEDMLHQARAAISESAQRQDYRHQYQQEITDQTLSEITARLSITLDERQAVEVFETSLADMGIRHARVALFEAEGDDPVAWSVLLSSRSELTSPRFSTREFPPPALYPSNEVLNVALIPLVFQDERLGYVAFDAGNLGPCAIIARQLAATFKASRLHTQVVELSLRDPLTGVHNRRYFDLFLNNEVNRNKRLGHGLTIIMLDIDHFKKYNDTYGHPAGDKAIQNVAHYVKGGRRSADIVARIGGEEFALILPETDIEGALIVAEKIRASIISSSDFERPITVSMGISTAVGTDLEAGTLLQQADFALYQAKRMGRNRICVFQNEATLPGS
jgi:diguanylate cyclase (GGDEF)-like protein